MLSAIDSNYQIKMKKMIRMRSETEGGGRKQRQLHRGCLSDPTYPTINIKKLNMKSNS